MSCLLLLVAIADSLCWYPLCTICSGFWWRVLIHNAGTQCEQLLVAFGGYVWFMSAYVFCHWHSWWVWCWFWVVPLWEVLGVGVGAMNFAAEVRVVLSWGR